jgi:hypothetical protein
VKVTVPVGIPEVPLTVAMSVADRPFTVGVVLRLADGGDDGGDDGGGGDVTVKGSVPQALVAPRLLESPE